MKDERELPGGPAAETLLEIGQIGNGTSQATIYQKKGEKMG